MEKTAIGSARERTRTRRMWRGVATATAVCALAGGAVLAVAGPSHAQTAQRSTALVALENVSTSQCLQDNGGNVSTQPCNGYGNQSWSVTDGAGRVVNAATTLCLQSTSRVGRYNNLHTRPCSKGVAGEIWAYGKSTALGEFTLVNRKTQLCLESDQYGYAYMQVCNPAHLQAWMDILEQPLPQTAPRAGN
jgi:hypothetical protein